MAKRQNSTLPFLIYIIVGIAAIYGIIRSTSWVSFWICIALLAACVILIILTMARPRRSRRGDYERNLSDRISHHHRDQP